MTVFILSACDKDDTIAFDVDPADVEITFEAFAGGAFMHYKLPKNSDIYAIRAKYKSDTGEEMAVKGTYNNNVLKLDGFINENKDVPVTISLIDNDENYSKSIVKEFSVDKCAANMIFDDMKVSSYWDGFSVKYTGPENSNGFVHIGYVGVNFQTKQLDTLLAESKVIEEGEQSFHFADFSDKTMEEITAVIWAEDFKGNSVKKQVFKDIPVLKTEKLDLNKDNVGFEGSDDRDEEKCRGWEYLFDGDNKGYKAFEEYDESKMYSFISKPDAVPGFWTIDLQEPKNIAYIRLYCPLETRISASQYSHTFASRNRLSPNRFKLYGSNNKNAPADSWDLLGNHYESATAPLKDRWIWEAINWENRIHDLVEFDKYEPCYVQANIDETEKKYRYIRLEILETFGPMNSVDKDPAGRTSFVELELYTEKKTDNE